MSKKKSIIVLLQKTKKIKLSKTHQSTQNIPHPKINFLKKNYDPTTFDNSTCIGTIEILIYQSLQKNNN
jgi:hypothetical protein